MTHTSDTDLRAAFQNGFADYPGAGFLKFAHAKPSLAQSYHAGWLKAQREAMNALTPENLERICTNTE